MSLKLEGMGISLSRLGAQIVLPFPPFKWKAFRIFLDKAANIDSVCQTEVCETWLTSPPTQSVLGHLEGLPWEKALVNIWNDVCGCGN